MKRGCELCKPRGLWRRSLAFSWRGLTLRYRYLLQLYLLTLLTGREGKAGAVCNHCHREAYEVVKGMEATHD